MNKLHYLLLGVGCVIFWSMNAGVLQGEDKVLGAESVEVIFDKNPIERGLTFDRTEVKPREVEIKGQKYEAWVSERAIEKRMGWTRTFRFKVTDPTFQKGGRGAVDIEIVFYLPVKGGVKIQADTASGARTIEEAWGDTKEWKTIRIRLDDAYFGARKIDGDVRLSLSDFDLRIDGGNGAFYLKSVKITGYNPNQNVQWARMVKIQDVTTSRSGNVLAFLPSAKQEFQLHLQNLAHIDRPSFYRFQITDYNGKVRHRDEGSLMLSGETIRKLPLTFNAEGWPLGPYNGKFELYYKKGDAEAYLSCGLKLGLVSGYALDKARDGEFFYGLDMANSYIYPTHTPVAFAYYRMMGVDILRTIHSKGEKEDVEGLLKCLKDLEPENVRGMLMMDPPKQSDVGQRSAELEKKTEVLKELFKRAGGNGVGKLQYCELGNEPDLLGFYPGTIAEYLESMYAMYDAIKKGAAEGGVSPNGTIVMNGGLSFAGIKGAQRSREFLELVDMKKLDAIAYHGHGPRIEAERNAYERIYGIAKELGKNNKPFIETESGFSAHEPRALLEQARTVVQKMTYAQSVGMPLFMYFRLFMNGTGSEGGYTMAENFIEPRPSVLSYRNMVERLRHSRYVSTLPFLKQNGMRGVNAYLFEETNEQNKVTGKKTIVAFCDKNYQNNLLIKLDDVASEIKNATTFDMFGNPAPAKLMAGNTAQLPVGDDPVYLTWYSAGATQTVQVAKPILSMDTAPVLLADSDTDTELKIYNPGEKVMSAELSLSLVSRLPLKTSLDGTKITVPPNSQISVPVKFMAGKAEVPFALPSWWKVFFDVNMDDKNVFSIIPETLRTPNGSSTGTFIYATGNKIDFGKKAGNFSEKRVAVAYTYLDSPVDIKLPCAASADWWMAWYVNGEKVFDTLEKGNEHGNLADHSFILPLKKGRNVIAVAVLAGRNGWGLEYGGPKERQIAMSPDKDTDMVTVVLKSEGKEIARQSISLKISGYIPSLGNVKPTESAKDWLEIEPLAVLGEESVYNLWFKEPQQYRWYAGAKDLSGQVWVRDDGRNLHFFASITDDKLVQATTVEKLGESDCAHMVLSDDAGEKIVDVMGGLIAGKSVATGLGKEQSFVAQRVEEEGVTTYHFTLPKAVVSGKTFHLNIDISDNDADYLKQHLRLGDMENLSAGPRMRAE